MSVSRAARALPVVSAAVTALAWLPIAGFVPDDTYIHLQYARHLKEGDGLVFNLGERVYASTSPLWSTFLAALGFLGLDLEAAAIGASMASALLASAMAARMFTRVLPWPAAAAAALLFAADVWFVRWAGSGMETSLAVLLVVLGFDRYMAAAPWGARPLAPATWWALAALVRPEAAILPGLLALRGVLEAGPPARRLARAGLALLPLALLGGAWTGFAWAYYGTPLPVTIHAKSIDGQGLGGAAGNVAVMATEFAASRPLELVAALLALAGFAAARRRVDVAHVVPAGWLVGLPLFYAASGVLGVTRYVVPLTPLLVFYGWRAIAGHVRGGRRLALVALVAAAAGMFTLAAHVVPQALAFRRGMAATWIAQGRWFAAHTPPGTRVALRDIGAFAYFSDRPVVDLGGLVTPAMVPLMRAHTYDDLAVGLGFGAVDRPEYLLDVATEPARMTADSPFAACLEPLLEGRLDHRALRKREAAWVSAYRIDWSCVDSTRRSSATR
jgi:hypothetical protein